MSFQDLSLRELLDRPWDVAVVGAGAAGLLAATRAAERGLDTVLLEKNPRPGVKILMSGGTRCNLTHDTDARGILAAYGKPGRFLHSALAALGPRELVALIEAEGVVTKVEPTGKIFPASDRAADVLDALLARLRRSGAQLICQNPVSAIDRDGEAFVLHLAAPDSAPAAVRACNVILTTGGKSYPKSGTSGDGYAWSAAFGHTIVPPRPALTPISTHEPWVTALKGITIEDVAARVLDPGDAPGAKETCLASRRGSMLFAHFGLSGPVILDLSRVVSGHPRPSKLVLECDFLPMVLETDLDDQLRLASVSAGNRLLAGVLFDRLPRRLVETLLERAGLAADRRSAELRREDRAMLVRSVKRQRIAVSGTLGFQKAEVTAGGVDLAQVDSRTMESKLVKGLYFAGELLDLDGPIGGYNFQAAFSTGWLAGERVS